MEPRIQYAKTSDGVNIAYWTLGEGPALLSFTLPVSHLMVESELAHLSAFFELASRSWKFARFNSRGFGLSDREVSDFSLSKMTLDLEAVADALKFETFALIAANTAVPVAIAYAARNPKRVHRLVLSQGGAGGAGGGRFGEEFPNFPQLARSDWRFVSEAVLHQLHDWRRGPIARHGARHLRKAVSGETYAEFTRQSQSWNVDDLLTRITAPTLLLYWSEHAENNPRLGQDLAEGLRNAKLMFVEGRSPTDFARARTSATLTFLGEEREIPPVELEDVALRELEHMRLPATILFADIVGSTALSGEIGDVIFRKKARELDAALRQIIRTASGIPIEGKLLGDGVLATFASANRAIEAALACGKAGAEAGLPLHLGLHAGDVIREEDPDGRSNVYGGAVNIAARISALSAPGEVLVSQAARDLFQALPRVAFRDRGAHKLKGIEDPVRLYEATWTEQT